MSFDINWDSLVSDAAINEGLANFLNNQLSSITLPEYLSGLRVVKCELGDRPPEITIRNIDVPFPEFYEDAKGGHETEDTESAHTVDATVIKHATPPPSQGIPTSDFTPQTISSNGISSRSSTPLSSPTHPTVLPGFMSRSMFVPTPTASFSGPGLGISGSYFPHVPSRSSSQISSRHSSPPPVQAEFDRVRSPLFNEDLPERESEYKPDDKDIQVVAEIKFDGDIYIEVTANLLVNFPAQDFISLPVRLKITDLLIHSIGVLAWLNSKLYVSILCDVEDDKEPREPESESSSRHSSVAQIDPMVVVADNSTNRERIDIIKRLRIEGELGSYGQDSELHKEGSILRNIGKIEKFLVASIRGILIRELAWPSWIMFDYNDDDDDDGDDEVDEEDPKGDL